MIRIFNKSTAYTPVQCLSPTRYRINFDFVPFADDENYGYWSEENYFEKPTTEQIQSDVVKYTLQRYEQEGLTPPTDIDVSQYIIQ